MLSRDVVPEGLRGARLFLGGVSDTPSTGPFCRHCGGIVQHQLADNAASMNTGSISNITHVDKRSDGQFLTKDFQGFLKFLKIKNGNGLQDGGGDDMLF